MKEDGIHQNFWGGLPEMPWKRKKKMRIQEVTIVHGYELWITFRDEIDVREKYWGRVYKNPTISSMDRLARVLPEYCDTRVERDGVSFVLIFYRGDKSD